MRWGSISCGPGKFVFKNTSLSVLWGPKMQNPLLSVLIPAYNNLIYTRKTLSSIFKQTYRPIEIILSDDNSPSSLEVLASEFQVLCSDSISFKYFRQSENLGHYSNMEFCLRNARGKYMVLLDHDDWLTDIKFFSDAVDVMERSDGCHAVVCNNTIEGTSVAAFKGYAHEFSLETGNEILASLFDVLTPNKCGMLFDFAKLRELTYLDYFICRSDCERLGVFPEDAYLPLCLLASVGKVAVSSRIVGVRGKPATSLSISAAWQKNVGIKHFLPFFSLLRYYESISFEVGLRKIEHVVLHQIQCEEVNVELLNFLQFDRAAITLMAMSAAFKNNTFSVREHKIPSQNHQYSSLNQTQIVPRRTVFSRLLKSSKKRYRTFMHFMERV